MLVPVERLQSTGKLTNASPGREPRNCSRLKVIRQLGEKATKNAMLRGRHWGTNS